MLYRYIWWWQLQKTMTILDTKYLFHTWWQLQRIMTISDQNYSFHTWFSYNLTKYFQENIKFDLNNVELKILWEIKCCVLKLFFVESLFRSIQNTTEVQIIPLKGSYTNPLYTHTLTHTHIHKGPKLPRYKFCTSEGKCNQNILVWNWIAQYFYILYILVLGHIKFYPNYVEL